MSDTERPDAVVVGSGPNGLAAAITLAAAGRSVLVLEAADAPGGACRSAELTEPGFVHDVGSAIHPLAAASPFFAGLDLEAYGLDWVRPPAAVGHAIDGNRAAIAWNDLDGTADGLGADAGGYRALYTPLVDRFDELIDLSLGPKVRLPSSPLFAARFGALAARSAAGFVSRFDTAEAKALFLGHACHAILPLNRPFTAAFGLMFGATAHAVGWPFPRGGAGALTTALVRLLEQLGGRIETGRPVRALADVPQVDIVIFALTPRQVGSIVGDHFPEKYRRRLSRFRYGPGVCKVDLALSDPIPWSNPDLAQTATVHVGGPAAEMIRSEAEVAKGRHPTTPFVLLAQHTLFDPSRAPVDGHTAWAYCHVPHGSTVDMSDVILDRIEAHAPGFRDTIIAKAVALPADLEAANANLVGGDVGGGSLAGTQLLARPMIQADPYRTADPRLFIGSASADPGAGVHGMAGHRAALSALGRSSDEFCGPPP